MPWFSMGLIVEAVHIDNEYVAMIFETMIPQLGINISLFFVADWANQKLGLLKVDSSEPLTDSSKTQQALNESFGSDEIILQ